MHKGARRVRCVTRALAIDCTDELAQVRRVEYFNDHLQEGRDRVRSDHGFVRALIKLR